MPRRSPTKTRIALQIYRDQYGFEARVKVRGTQTVKRFGPDTPLSTMQRWQLDTREVQEQPPLTPPPAPSGAPPAPPPTGASLESRLEAFFLTITARVAFKADRSHLRAWVCAPGADGVALGKKDPAAITTRDVTVVINAWRTPLPADAPGHPRAVRRITVSATMRGGKTIDGYVRKTPTTGSNLVVAVRTVRHRCRLLREFLVTEKVPTTELDAVKIPAVPKSHPVGVDVETVRAVAKALANSGDAKTCARYLVLATTAQRPAQVMRAQPEDVNLKARLWIVRSAKNEPAHTIYLNTEMVKAWRAFIAAAAWGVYDTSQHAIVLRRCGWPATIRPYNARHSVIQDALRDYDVQLDDAQGLAGHTQIDTTRTFYGPLAINRQRHISDAINGRMKGVFGPRLVKKKKTG